MASVEVVSIGQVEHEKQTEDFRVQIKSELSQLGDSTVLTFIDLVQHLVFKHIQERAKNNNQCFWFFFSSTDVFV